MKTHVLLLGALLPLATVFGSSNSATSTDPACANAPAAAKAGKDANESPATAAPAAPATKPNAQKREGRTALPAYLFM